MSAVSNPFVHQQYALQVYSLGTEYSDSESGAIEIKYSDVVSTSPSSSPDLIVSSRDSASHSPLTPFFSLPLNRHEPPPPPLPLLIKFRNRIKRISTFVIGWGAEMICKIIECFQSIQFEQPRKPILEAQEEHGKEFCQLFHSFIHYEKFHNQVLNNPVFNNYNFLSYREFKKQNQALSLDQYLGENRKVRAGTVVYDAIVRLYVHRFLETYPELNQKEYLPSLRTVALIIAIKESLDKEVFNRNFQYFLFPFIGIYKLRKMEIEFAKGLNWNFSTIASREEIMKLKLIETKKAATEVEIESKLE